jgi:hypothetical protein
MKSGKKVGTTGKHPKGHASKAITKNLKRVE